MEKQTTEEKTNHAKAQARTQLDSILAMVKRLEHCQYCEWEDCDLTDKEILEGINLYYKEGDKATDEELKQYHDEDDAKESIFQSPLEVQVRGDWHNPGEEIGAIEFKILLYRNPAVRIRGELGSYNRPKRAWLEYQDWLTSWVDYQDITHEESDMLLTYTRVFYFGE